MTPNTMQLPEATVKARQEARAQRLAQTAEQRTKQIRAKRGAERKQMATKAFFTPRSA